MCLLIIVILSLCKVEFSEGIIGGTEAEPGEFPFMVSLRNETNKHYCGGSLITRRHVLTAAHCLFTDQSVFDYEIVEMYEASVIKAVVNTLSIADFGGDFYQASKLSPHPAYNVTDISILHDIGVIELKYEITNENVTIISLPSAPVAYEEMATVIGWGINTRDNVKDLSKMSQVLQKADMKVMRPENCIDIYLDKILEYAFVTEAVFVNKSFCSAQDHVNVCYRDSGSPLIQDGNLTGIVVFGNECKEGSPDIFTSVFEYLEFILDCIEDRCTAITDVRQLFELKDLL